MESPKEQSSYTVEQLVAVNPFNPEILPDLENYVNEQVRSFVGCLNSKLIVVLVSLWMILSQVTLQTYSLDANLCLLRLYQVVLLPLHMIKPVQKSLSFSNVYLCVVWAWAYEYSCCGSYLDQGMVY